MSQSETNKNVVRRFFTEIFNQNLESVIPQVISDDYRDHGSNPPLEGPAGALANLRGLRAGFTDVQFKIDELLCDGDAVIARWTGQMVHNAEFYGHPATGNAITFTGITIYHLRDEKIVSAHPAQDLLGLFRQLQPTQ